MNTILTLALLVSAFTLAMVSFFGTVAEHLPRSRWLYLFFAAMILWALGLIYFGATFENTPAIINRSNNRF